jgi:hypothetical protein
MNEQSHGSEEAHGASTAQESQPVLHRVCIQCNNMFRVTAKNFDAKQCPNCHKG